MGAAITGAGIIGAGNLSSGSVSSATIDSSFYSGLLAESLADTPAALTARGWTESAAGGGSMAAVTTTGVIKAIYGGNAGDTALFYAVPQFNLSNVTSATLSIDAIPGTSTSIEKNLIGFSTADSTSQINIRNYADRVATQLETTKAGSGTTTSTGTNISKAAYHNYKIVATSAAVSWYIDDILQETNTTNIPVVAIKPYFGNTSNGMTSAAFDTLFKNFKLVVVR